MIAPSKTPTFYFFLTFTILLTKQYRFIVIENLKMSIWTEYTQESQLNKNALYIVTVSLLDLLECLSNF